MTSLVSIIIPSYNRAGLIGKTLQSIQAQSHDHWECIVVDDASEDNTKEVVSAFAKADSRISYHKRPVNRLKGANACRNYGYELSKGEFVNWFDSDDLMHPEKIRLQLAALQESGKNYCICKTSCYDNIKQQYTGLRSESITSLQPLDDYIQFHIFWTTITPLWKREFIEVHHLGFDEGIQQSQEYDFHTKAMLIDADYAIVNRELCTLVTHKDNLSISTSNRLDKYISNIAVRAAIFHRSVPFIKDETCSYLHVYIFRKYREALLEGEIGKARMIWPYLKSTSKVILKNQQNSMINLYRWWLAIPVYALFGKGDYFTRYIR
jgi:glycosyltransferase involved in cell wall biosynthesis